MISRIATIVPTVAPVALPAAWTRYALVDRGSYEHAELDPPPALVALASDITGRTLRPLWARAVRLVPGDYILAHHDHAHDDHRVELMLDLSPAVVPGAEVRYRRRGAVMFRFPSQPGAASIVERDPTMQCYHTYVSKLHASGTCIVRLVVLLADAT